MLRDGIRTIGFAVVVLCAVFLSAGIALADADYYYVATKVRAQAGGVQNKWYNFKEIGASGLDWRLNATTADWPLVVTLEVIFERFGAKKDLYGPEIHNYVSVYVDGVKQGLVIPSGSPQSIKWMYSYFPKSGAHTIYIGYNNPDAHVTAEGFDSTVKIVPRIKLNW